MKESDLQSKNTETNFFSPVHANDIVAGDKIVNVFINIENKEIQVDLNKKYISYVTYIKENFGDIGFRNIIEQLLSFKSLSLQDFYIPLIAQIINPSYIISKNSLFGQNNPIEDSNINFLADDTAIKAENVLREADSIAIIGDPGCGKTTLLKYLALTNIKASELSQENIPIFLPLVAYDEFLNSDKSVNLQEFLSIYYSGCSAQTRNLEDLFDYLLDAGKAVVYFDGFDEIRKNKSLIIDRLESFSSWAIGKKNKIVLSSRKTSYYESPLSKSKWKIFSILEFSNSSVNDFIDKWFGLLIRVNKNNNFNNADLANKLKEILKRQKEIQNLSKNPLMLMIILTLFTLGVDLPKHKVKLYDSCLEYLLQKWNKSKLLSEAFLDPVDYYKIMTILGKLFLWIQEEHQEKSYLHKNLIITRLNYIFENNLHYKVHEAFEESEKFFNLIKHSCIIQEIEGGKFSFIHQSLKELIIAYGLVQIGNNNFEEFLTKIDKYISQDNWHEIFILAIEYWMFIYEDNKKINDVLEYLITMNDKTGKNVLLSGACIRNIGKEYFHQKIVLQIEKKLQQTCQSKNYSPYVQRDAGFFLGDIGWLPKDIDEMIFISKNTIINKRIYKIERDFEIGKYPVTNYQYSKFVNDGGYKVKKFWSDKGWAWKNGQYDKSITNKGELIFLSKRPKELRNLPLYWSEPTYNNPIAPVVGVTYFEVEAYCNWLHSKTGGYYRLPTYYEWLLTAAGPLFRKFAWGQDEDTKRVNCAEFWLSKSVEDAYDFDNNPQTEMITSPIIQFPLGQTPNAVYDLCGNVVEWTTTAFKDMNVKDKHEDFLEFRVSAGGLSIMPFADCFCYGFFVYPDSSSIPTSGFRIVLIHTFKNG